MAEGFNMNNFLNITEMNFTNGYVKSLVDQHDFVNASITNSYFSYIEAIDFLRFGASSLKLMDNTFNNISKLDCFLNTTSDKNNYEIFRNLFNNITTKIMFKLNTKISLICSVHFLNNTLSYSNITSKGLLYN